MTERVFRAERRHDFCVWIEAHAVIFQIPRRHLRAQILNAARGAVTVDFRIFDRFGQLVDNALSGRIGRAAHAEVDDVGALAAFRVFERVEFGEEVGGQFLNTVGDVDLERARVVRRVVGRFERFPVRGDRFQGNVDKVFRRFDTFVLLLWLFKLTHVFFLSEIRR